MKDITIPKARPDFDGEQWQGSLQQLLKANIGELVRVEYHVEGGAPFVGQGNIYAVGKDYLLLWDSARRTYTTGNLAHVVSLTFFPAKD